MQTCRMKDGRIYVATLGGGCQLLASKNLLADGLKFKEVNKQNEQTVQGLVCDNDDNLWMVGDSRISVLTRAGMSRNTVQMTLAMSTLQRLCRPTMPRPTG